MVGFALLNPPYESSLRAMTTCEIVLATRLCVRALRTTTPKKVRPLPQKRERSAERRIVQPMSADRRQVYTADKCTQSAYKTCLRNLSATRLRNLFAEARPPFGAHACGTRHRLLPRWLSPRTGFPEDSSSQVFCPLASSLRLSTLRADRSLCRPTGDPGPPGCGLAIPRAGTAPRSAFQACVPERRPR